ncbi:MAG: hypothetical protein LBL90_10575 [Prevotellaceae bacterium]|nr:hypothetical protein [Prevotellaceae bacterium]
MAEVKKELLAQHLVAIGKELHWLIADTQGNTTLFKADSKEGFIFTDEQPNRPFIITNYHL